MSGTEVRQWPAFNGILYLLLLLLAFSLAACGAGDGTSSASGAQPQLASGVVVVTGESNSSGITAASSQVLLLAGNDSGAGIADGLSLSARFDRPTGIARAGDGTLYVADQFNSTIRKITPAGIVTTLAGLPGARGYADGKGSEARFALPWGVAVGEDGNIYVTDMGSATVRKIRPDGTVTTVVGMASANGFPIPGAGNPLAAPTGIAVDASGTIYVADRLTVKKITPAGNVSTIAGQPTVPGFADGPAASATFINLLGLALDKDGNIYVVDSGFIPGPIILGTFFEAASIRKISPSGIVSTVAGAATAGDVPIESILGYVEGKGAAARFNNPQDIKVGSDGNLYVSDAGNRVVRKVTPDGTTTTVAGVPREVGSNDGDALEAHFSFPSGLAVGLDGVLYLADSSNQTIRRVIVGDGVSTIAGAAPRTGSTDGVRTAALFSRPLGITHDSSGNLFVADNLNDTIRRIAPDGLVSTFAGMAGQAGNADGRDGDARFNLPRGVAADNQGNVLVADEGNDLIRRIDKSGLVSTYIDPATGGPAQFGAPRSIVADQAGNFYVLDSDERTISRLARDGSITVVVGPDTSLTPVGSGPGNGLVIPLDIAVDKTGNLYVIDLGFVIRKVAPDGTMTILAGVPFQSGTQDGTGSDARFNSPVSLTVDDVGNVYVGDARAIRKVTPGGVVTTIAGVVPENVKTGSFANIHSPAGLVFTSPKTLAFTQENGVFELGLP